MNFIELVLFPSGDVKMQLALETGFHYEDFKAEF
jgi:hypothetical protein